MLSGNSGRDVSTLIPAGVSLNVVSGSNPDANTQALLVSRSGLAGLNRATLQSYLDAGGIVITEFNITDEVFNLAFDEAVTQGPRQGACWDRVTPVEKLNLADPFWQALSGIATVPASQSGCGYSVSAYPGITALGGWGNGTTQIAYRDRGAGRLWLVDADWQDTDLTGPAYADSEAILGYMITNGAGQVGGGSVSATTVVQVNDVAPTLVLDPVLAIDENGVATLTGTISDPGTLDTFTLDIDWGDPLSPNNVATYSFGASSTGTQTFTLTHQYLDDNPSGDPSNVYTINATVTDDDTLSGSGGTTVQVDNVDPVITAITSGAEECGSAHEDEPITLELAFDDIGSLDVHTVTVDWGDGQTETIVLPVGDRSLSVDHDYEFGGIYTISVTLTDDDTGTDSDSVLAVVSGVVLHDGVLQIIGTSADDHVTVNQTGNGLLKVHADFIAEYALDETRDFQLADVDRIFMLLCDGDDHATVSGRVTLDTLIDGGAGDDHLNGGDGSDLILGRDGNDHINGGSGRDILIGGLGEDRIIGNPQRDLISGGVLQNSSSGATGTIADESDLLTMQSRLRDATDAEIDAWRDGSDDFFAGLALELVDDAGAADQLTGSSADDWFVLFDGDAATDESSNGNGSGGTNKGNGKK